MVGTDPGMAWQGLAMALLWLGQGLAMAWPWLGHGYAMTWPCLGHGSAMAWAWLGHADLCRHTHTHTDALSSCRSVHWYYAWLGKEAEWTFDHFA